MSIFKSIDQKLHEFARKHNGFFADEVFENVRDDGKEGRTLIWEDGMLENIIFISPGAFVEDGWDVVVYASLVDNGERHGEVPFWQKYLLQGVQFQAIEHQIEYLLAESEKSLSEVKVEDMRLDWTYLDGKLVDNRINKD